MTITFAVKPNGVAVQTGPRPGAHLFALLSEIGAHAQPDCPCRERAALMDEWGPAKCRENFAVIVDWVRESYAELKDAGQMTFFHRAKIGALAVKAGIAWKVNPLDPIPGLIELAFQRSEGKAASPAGCCGG